jgi:hypothetical protein
MNELPEEWLAAIWTVPVNVGDAENATLVDPVVPETTVPCIFATVAAYPEVVTSPVSGPNDPDGRVPVTSDARLTVLHVGIRAVDMIRTN